MATMALLLLIEESGWQAALGQLSSRGGDSSLGSHDDEDLFATVLIGRADGNDVPSASLAREIPSRESRVRAVGR